MIKWRLAKSVCRDRSGSVSILVAVTAPVFIGCCALALDFGMVHLERTRLQGASDLAVLAAANASRAGKTDAEYEAAAAVLAQNGFPDAKFTLINGRYEADAALPVDRRFVAEATPANAVHIDVQTSTDAYLSRIFGFDSYAVEARALARTQPQAAFSIASALATVDNPLTNGLLKALTGRDIELSLVDAKALARVDIGPRQLASALAEGSTYDLEPGEALDRATPLGELVDAIADTLAATGDLAQSAIARRLAVDLRAVEAAVRPASLFGLDANSVAVEHLARGVNARVNAGDLLSAGLTQAGVGTALETKLGLPGLLGVDVDLLLGEGAQHSGPIAVGGPGAKVSTAQLRARIDVKVGALGLLSDAGLINLPIEIVAAGGEAELVGLSCLGPNAPEATFAVRPGLLRLSVADYSGDLADATLDPARRPATLVRLPLVAIKGVANVSIRDTQAQTLTFDARDVEARRIQSVAARNVTRSLVSQLLDDLTRRGNLELEILGLGLGLGGNGLVDALADRLVGLTGVVDQAVNGVLVSAGIKLGQIDLRVSDIDCSTAQLAG